MWWLLFAACGPSIESDEPEDTDLPHAALQFGFPLLERDRFRDRTGVDHDATEQDDDAAGRVICKDYLDRGFPHCYDQHDGSDFLMVGGFDTMDAGSASILAAADGVVVEAHDGEYDRCHASLATGDIDCDGHPVIGNHVILEHEGGVRTLYWHMMTGSVAVTEGAVVTCGTVLGKVGSSGWSSMPHLHFEVNAADGSTIDPYAGPLSQDETWWADQTPTDELPGDGCTASAR
jgi:hypothetical protein